MFLDIAVGIFGVTVFVHLTGAEPSAWLFTFAIACALLPDADVLFHLLRGHPLGKYAHRHRTFLHYPLLFLPAVFLTLLPLGFSYSFMATGLVCWHFLHDSVGIGWGVQWQYPFGKRYYKFMDAGSFVRGRTPQQVEQVAAKRGDPDWLRNTYFRPSPTLILELVMLVIAFTAAMYLLIR